MNEVAIKVGKQAIKSNRKKKLKQSKLIILFELTVLHLIFLKCKIRLNG